MSTPFTVRPSPAYGYLFQQAETDPKAIQALALCCHDLFSVHFSEDNGRAQQVDTFDYLSCTGQTDIYLKVMEAHVCLFEQDPEYHRTYRASGLNLQPGEKKHELIWDSVLRSPRLFEHTLRHFAGLDVAIRMLKPENATLTFERFSNQLGAALSHLPDLLQQSVSVGASTQFLAFCKHIQTFPSDVLLQTPRSYYQNVFSRSTSYCTDLTARYTITQLFSLKTPDEAWFNPLCDVIFQQVSDEPNAKSKHGLLSVWKDCLSTFSTSHWTHAAARLEQCLYEARSSFLEDIEPQHPLTYSAKTLTGLNQVATAFKRNGISVTPGLALPTETHAQRNLVEQCFTIVAYGKHPALEPFIASVLPSFPSELLDETLSSMRSYDPQPLSRLEQWFLSHTSQVKPATRKPRIL